ncbi:hypothetical protein A2U01_0038068, partial [Trifolium medium]|nr:hypothetical protein [Trifolium medium]
MGWRVSLHFGRVLLAEVVGSSFWPFHELLCPTVQAVLLAIVV